MSVVTRQQATSVVERYRQAFEARWRASEGGRELKRVRNIKPGFKRGTWFGMANSALEAIEYSVMAGGKRRSGGPRRVPAGTCGALAAAMVDHASRNGGAHTLADFEPKEGDNRHQKAQSESFGRHCFAPRGANLSGNSSISGRSLGFTFLAFV